LEEESDWSPRTGKQRQRKEDNGGREGALHRTAQPKTLLLVKGPKSLAQKDEKRRDFRTYREKGEGRERGMPRREARVVEYKKQGWGCAGK